MVSLAEEPPNRLEGQLHTIRFLIMSLSICTIKLLFIPSARSPCCLYSLICVISVDPFLTNTDPNNISVEAGIYSLNDKTLLPIKDWRFTDLI